MGPTDGWRFIEVPLPLSPQAANKDRLRETIYRVAGSLALWSSRIHGFDPKRFPNAAAVSEYCVDRIARRRECPRPTTEQISGCLLEVADQIDPLSYRALNELSIVFRAIEAKAGESVDSSLWPATNLPDGVAAPAPMLGPQAHMRQAPHPVAAAAQVVPAERQPPAANEFASARESLQDALRQRRDERSRRLASR